jgi:hypothetical protein
MSSKGLLTISNLTEIGGDREKSETARERYEYIGADLLDMRSYSEIEFNE